MQKFLGGFILGLLLVLAPTAEAVGFKGQAFQKIFYFSGASGSGAHSGLSSGNAKAIADSDLVSIDAGSVISKAYIIIDTAITGTTVINVGDQDDVAGFVNGPASLTMGTPGVYGYSAEHAGHYLRLQTPGASTAADLYVVPQAKFYPAAGKTLKIDTTGTNTGGAFRLVVEGFRS